MTVGKNEGGVNEENENHEDKNDTNNGTPLPLPTNHPCIPLVPTTPLQAPVVVVAVVGDQKR